MDIIGTTNTESMGQPATGNQIDLSRPLSTMFTASGNANINVDANHTVGSTVPWVTQSNYWPYYVPYNDYYSSCFHTNIKPDNYQTAFRLARKLMDKKMTKELKTIEDFFKLMNVIIEVL